MAIKNRLPAFNSFGMLPPGQHRCTWAMMHVVFGTNPWREKLIANLDLCLKDMRSYGLSGVVFIDGSFVTDKEQPNDLDLVLDVRSCKKETQALALLYRMNEASRVKADWHIDWWPNLTGNNNFVSFFQYAGETTAAIKKCSSKEPKGILRLAKW